MIDSTPPKTKSLAETRQMVSFMFVLAMVGFGILAFCALLGTHTFALVFLGSASMIALCYGLLIWVQDTLR
jgi:hypothetical protein